jgi:cholesterol transport system auxiliary component
MLQKTIATLLSLMTSLFLLSACSVFAPVKTEPATTYVLNSVPTGLTRTPHGQWSILVTPPEANNIYNTPQMVYTDHRYAISYFVKNLWAETPSQMLQPLIIQTLQNTGYFHFVSASMPLVQYDYILNTQLVELQQDYSHFPYTVHLIVRAQLFNTSTNTMIGTREFSVTEPLRQNTPYGGVIAANQATKTVLGRLAQFCLNKIK